MVDFKKIFGTLFRLKQPSELICIVDILFASKNAAALKLTGKEKDSEERETNLINVFIRYYPKILYNLGRSKVAEDLIRRIDEIVKQAIGGDNLIRTNIMPGNFEIQPTIEKQEMKKYSAQLFKEKIKYIQTEMSFGDEEYFAPLPVLLFLQYLINKLGNGSLTYLMIAIEYLHEFYANYDYTDMESIAQGQIYALHSTQNELTG